MSVHTLENRAGVEIRVAAYGGIILSVRVPDRDGRLADVVLGHEAPADYVNDGAYLGAIIGRYANRIADARYAIDGVEYELAANEGANQLHGGIVGFDDVVWGAEPFRTTRGSGVAFAHASPDGDQGHPGTLRASVTYLLTDASELVIDWRATTDRATHVNLTQHSYFNLGGHDAGDVLEHVLTVHADRYLPVDERMIPTGELRPVAGTPFDFREPVPIGARIDDDDAQLRRCGGYDHCYVLGGEANASRDEAERLAPAARLVDPGSGRVLEVRTTEPGMQLYTGNGLGVPRGKGGVVYGPHAGVALETQHFPDSPNRPDFPSTLLRPGEEYRSRTVYAFGVE